MGGRFWWPCLAGFNGPRHINRIAEISKEGKRSIREIDKELFSRKIEGMRGSERDERQVKSAKNI